MKKSAVRFERGTASRKGERLMAYRGHTKRKGELSELAFAYKAVSMGFGVSKPYGDSERFDFIVTSGRRVWRVQVKSVYKASYRGYGVRACGNRNRGGLSGARGRLVHHPYPSAREALLPLFPSQWETEGDVSV